MLRLLRSKQAVTGGITVFGRSEQEPKLPQLPSSGNRRIDQTAPLPAVISHLLFEPTLLATTGRRRFTLQNDTTGDLPVRWGISEIFPLQENQQKALKGAGTSVAPARAGDSPGLSPVCNAVAPGAWVAELGRQRTQHVAETAVPAGAAAAAAAAATATAAAAGGGGGSGRDQVKGADGTRRNSRQDANVASAVTSTPRSIGGRDGKSCADLGSSSRSGIAASSSSPPPPSSSVGVGTVVLTADETAAVAAAAAAAARVPHAGPFRIFPEFAVVPAHGEFAFEVAFSPADLGESRCVQTPN